MSATPRSADAGSTRLLVAGTFGALVALLLGLYGTTHDPASDLAITLGFKDTITMKVWLASGSVLLAVVQLISALWLYGRLSRNALRPEIRCRAPSHAGGRFEDRRP